MKQLIDRFHYASQSPFGTLLLILFAILVVLGVSYTVLFLLRRKQDQLTAKNLFYFNHAEELIKEWIFEGEHRADFFGRETRACTKDGVYGRCLILPQELSTSETVGRFRQFASAKEGTRLAVFAPYLYKHDENPLFVIQGKVAKPSGQQLALLQSFMKDAAVSDAEKETLLMELAKALEQLHRLKDKDGISLYHGFILPRSCYIEKTDNGHSLVVADLGLAYTLGPDGMYQRLQLLKNAKLPIEKYTGNALIQQIALLAPEQKDPERFACVGSPRIIIPLLRFLSYSSPGASITRSIGRKCLKGGISFFSNAYKMILVSVLSLSMTSKSGWRILNCI
ncbi:MAG: hypothetical protein KDK72_08175 [Chlamydiia bacterium]|nr:hypothetical protein [Chlamydiia bacterium]